MTVRHLIALLLPLGLTLAAASGPAHAQTPVWKGSVQGAMTLTGNTLGLDATATGASHPGDMDGIGTFIADPGVWGSVQNASYPVGTTSKWTENGSTAYLDVPGDAPIVRAQLVWSCATKIGTEVPDATLGTSTTVTVRLPDGTSHVVAPDGGVTDLTLVNADHQFYQRWADVTSLVSQGGPGAYTVSKVYGLAAPGYNYVTGCGWTLFTVYQDPTESVRVFGLWMTAKKVCYTGEGCPANSEVTLSGFCTPEAGQIGGRLFATALEGDARWTGDSLELETDAGVYVPLNGPNNAATNFFASQINDEYGALDVTGTFGARNDEVSPVTGAKDTVTPVLQARQGWDITAVPLNGAYNANVLTNGQDNVRARFTTNSAAGGGDDYIVSAVGMEIDVKAPAISVEHSANRTATFTGDHITYTVTLKNDGFATADAVYLCYTDPPNATRTGSILVGDVPVTTGTLNPSGCLAGNGGVPVGAIAVGASATITLEYAVDNIAAAPGPNHTVITTPSWYSTWTDPCAGELAQGLSGTGQTIEVPGARLAVVLTASPLTPPNLLTDDVITYTASISNVGAADSPPTSTFAIPVPAGTAYVAGSTTYNGASLADAAGGTLPFATLREIHSPGAANGVVKLGQPVIVTFQVKVTATTPMFVINQGKADIDGAAGVAPERFSNQTSTGVGGADIDGDGIIDIDDNCPTVYNPDQANHYDLFGYTLFGADDAEGDVCDDTDGDGLLDSEEDPTGDGWNQGQETSATNPDTDGDGLCDGAITVATCFGHEDQDGDKSRFDWGNTETSPIDSDTDGDGLCDGRKVTATDCEGSEDADGDADPHDFDEATDSETNPLNPDTDGGGVDDGTERQAGTNPLDACEGDTLNCGGPDQDHDGFDDDVDNCPTVYNPAQLDNYPPGGNGKGDVCDDVDLDGLTDRAEDLGPDGVPGTGDETNPQDADTDGDGLCDGAITVPPCVGPEDRDGDRDPADWGTTETSPIDSDSDDDGLCDGFRRTALDCSGGEDQDGDNDPTDYDEPTDHETNPLDPDTDDGGTPDGAERLNQTNPLDPCDDHGDFCGAMLLEGGACQGGGADPTAPVALVLALGLLVALRRRSRRA
ncbi:MAG: hypothetical protein EP329_05275 [Deltaproteobacteria bacterium]|nr:MAG: hypothetical protein EP329_05275 [Deltaproteobacteria bacterium]